MKKSNSIALFDQKQVRRIWDDIKELWYFSVADVVGVLTDSVDAGAYWRKLKQRLTEEGSEVVTKCHGLKFMASDGKYYVSDAADTETMFRIIQSIPSPKAEPFKLWLAKTGQERINVTTIYRYIDAGKLKACKIGKEFRIEKSEFERFMNKAKTK